MGVLQHVYLTAHGSYISGNEWYGESAQMGVRMTLELVNASPDRGAVYSPGECGNIALITGTQAGTHGTLAKSWTARAGAVGSTENFDPSAQIDCAEDFWTFLNASKAYVTSGFRWETIKCAPVQADGKYGAAASVYTLTTPLAGTGAGQLPPELAVALSWRAPVLGRRGRGRMYLPALGSGISTGGTINSAEVTTLLSSMVTFAGNLENLPGWTNYVPRVAIMSAGSATAIRPVQVRVGNHFDIQQRRARSVGETYSATTL